MSILDGIVKQTKAKSPVEKGQVIELKGNRAKIQLTDGTVWAKSIPDLKIRDYVSVVRIGDDLQVLNLARKPRGITKTVRL